MKKNKYKILIIDDNPDIRQILSHYCKEYGLVVYTANNGEEALHNLNMIKPNIILTDSCMPKMTGEQFLSRIQNQLHKYYVIGMSGDNVKHQFYSLGVKHFLHKPFSVDLLHHVLTETIKYFNSQYVNIENCLYNFDNYPEFHDDINQCKETLKIYGIDYMGIDMHTFNDDFILWKNDHKKWQEVMTEQFIDNFKSNPIEDHKKTLDSYTHISSTRDNFIIPITALKNGLFDTRASIIGERKNGLFLFLYNEQYQHKIGYTVTFQDSNMSAFNISSQQVRNIISNVTSFNNVLSPHFNKMSKDKINSF